MFIFRAAGFAAGPGPDSSAIARELQEAGRTVRTLTGHPERGAHGSGIEARPLDFDDPAGLVASLTGTTTLFNTYWVRFAHGGIDHPTAVENSRVLFQAAKRAGVRKIVIAANGASLYPGHATTELCPTITFDGDALYLPAAAPDAAAIAARRAAYYAPYHAALAGEIKRLRSQFVAIIVYDCHSIRSRIPRLFAGDLPHFNLGTYDGASCAPALASAIEGGFITRHYGRPHEGVHGVQMELACRGYMREDPGPVELNSWPPHYDPQYAAPMRQVLTRIMEACLAFARSV